jgi:hypothetical protein
MTDEVGCWSSGPAVQRSFAVQKGVTALCSAGGTAPSGTPSCADVVSKAHVMM